MFKLSYFLGVYIGWLFDELIETWWAQHEVQAEQGMSLILSHNQFRCLPKELSNPLLGAGFKHFFYVHPYLGKISNLTNIFQVGWNHHLA